MGSFTKSHNLKKLPIGNWRSLHGYGATHLVHGRLLLCGYDVSLNLWRDAKYDSILEANGVPFRIEIKSTGVTKDPFSDVKSQYTFTSNVRSGRQISRSAPSREKMVSTEDADFALESSKLSKAQILQQSAMAMIAQAGKIQQNVLQLLQN